MDIGLFIFRLIAGAVVGAIAGLIGGAISGYFDPLAKMIDTAGRSGLAKVGAGSAKVLGAIAGLIVGAIVAVVGDIVPPLALFVVAAILFAIIAQWLERAAGESIAGLPGGVVAGAILGVLGGYTGRFIVKIIFDLS